MSATESVDTTPTCTRADAHFSRAHITVHCSYSTALFQCGHTALAKGKRNLCCALLFDHFHLVCHVLVKRSFCPFPSGHVLTSMLFVSRPSASSTSFGGSRQEPCASAHWSGMSGCLANPTPNTGYEPKFHSYMNEERSTRRSISLTITEVSSAVTTLPSSQPPKIYKVFRIQQQQANRIKQSSHNVRILRCEPLETVA